MRKLNIRVTIGIILSLIIFFLGLEIFAIGSIPLQDANLAPKSAIIEQQIEYYTGLIMLLVGTIIFWGSIIWRVIAGAIYKKKNKNNV